MTEPYHMNDGTGLQHPHPGTSCPTCQRRVPYPKKKDSPKTKVFSIRVPVDELVGLKEQIEAASYAPDPLPPLVDGEEPFPPPAIRERPHYPFWVLVYALAEWNQDHFA